LSRFLRICNQSLKKGLIWPKKKFFFEKIKKCVKKRRISRCFRIRWKSFKKMYQKKVISKNVTEKCTFFTFTHVRQTCFAYNFFLVHFLTTFSTDSKSAWNSAFCDTFFLFKKKKIFLGHISPFFKLYCKCAGHGSKNQKTYLVNVSQISILHPSKGLYSLFSKKKSNSLYPNGQLKLFIHPSVLLGSDHSTALQLLLYFHIFFVFFKAPA
jgi:hypothetical protein